MDGLTHINIYSKGKTALGQLLSNFAVTPIKTLDGSFASLEGYWYWLLAGEGTEKELLRGLIGNAAKQHGRTCKADDWSIDPVFKLKIYNAMLSKLILHNDILSEFLNNKLPFRHYYVFNGKIIEPKEGQWIIDMWTFLQEQLCTQSNSDTKMP